MDKNELHKRILEEEDYIRCPKCSNSIQKFMSRNPNGVENSVIGRLLMIPENEVEKVYDEAVKMIQKDMKDED